MKNYTVKVDDIFGDIIYRGEHGAAKIVKGDKNDPYKWRLYLFYGDSLSADDKVDCKSKKMAVEMAISHVTTGFC